MGATAPRGGYPVCAWAVTGMHLDVQAGGLSMCMNHVRCWVWGKQAVQLWWMLESRPDWRAPKGYSPAFGAHRSGHWDLPAPMSRAAWDCSSNREVYLSQA